MIALSSEAEAQIDSLIEHFEARGRPDAAINLLRTLERAKDRILSAPEAGLTKSPVISGVFYVTADIPSRI